MSEQLEKLEKYIQDVRDEDFPGLNLDSMSSDLLQSLYLETHYHPRIWAKKLNLSVRDCKHYSNYAINKTIAIEARIAGDIKNALKYENICENIYGYMSKSGRW
jgi:5-formaminoimidazole-4-carboxamide-1-beta-D-ribofuranosyl 5'-monophosphate synthetase